jgi:hypothetical protein
MKTYSEKLRDERWLKRRSEILLRYDNKCYLCGASSRLEVHHLWYEHNKEPWDYPNDALIPLCHECHKLEHNHWNQDNARIAMLLRRCARLTDVDMGCLITRLTDGCDRIDEVSCDAANNLKANLIGAAGRFRFEVWNEAETK